MSFISQLIFFVASLAIGYATRPRAPVPKPASLEEFKIPQIEEGTPQIVVFGDVWIDDWMVLGLGNFRTEPIVTKSGKK